MTPTEQDKGVFDMREWLKNEGWLWHESHVITPECMDDMQTALDKYAKRVALEAQIKAYENAKNYVVGFNRNTIEWIESDITRLKAQQEEL